MAGFGTLLGNALALLYVARHGLKEQEIWGLLTSLQKQEEATRKAKEALIEGRKDGSANAKGLIALIFAARGVLEDLCRSEDSQHSGTITHNQFYSCLVKIHADFNKQDMLRLLEVTGMIGSGASGGGGGR